MKKQTGKKWSRRSILKAGAASAAAISTLMFFTHNACAADKSKNYLSKSGKLAITSLNSVRISVSDPAASLKWYQETFGLPIQSRNGKNVVLRIGPGPAFLEINGTPTDKPRYEYLCLTVDKFNADKVQGHLLKEGLTKSKNPGPNQVTLRKRSADQGGAPEGTPELFLGDPDGLVVQIQDTTYRGGSGLLGNEGPKMAEVAPGTTERPLRIREINHVTVLVSDEPRATKFWSKLFDMPIDAYQGPSPLLRIEPGNQSVVLYDGSTSGVKPYIDHVCLTVDDFNPDRILTVLEKKGLTILGQAFRAIGPLQAYVTMRKPDRGGDAVGTAELYLTDPDGLVIQLQDHRYRGGCGFLGEHTGTPEYPSDKK
ncbi:MAG: VOC family protein [Deltaproteobacteria bacterium]|nr:VOC family protein [Deltaproteobacteria bacterium]